MLKYIKIIFFLCFFKLFLRSAHRNNLKHKKKLILNKFFFEIFGKAGWPAFPNTLYIITRCYARAMPRACGMFVRYRGFMEKKLYGKKLLQSIMFSRKKLQS